MGRTGEAAEAEAGQAVGPFRCPPEPGSSCRMVPEFCQSRPQCLLRKSFWAMVWEVSPWSGWSAVSLLPLHVQRGSLGPTCGRPGGAPGEEDGGIGGNWMRTDRRRRGLIVPQDTVRPGATRPTSPGGGRPFRLALPVRSCRPRSRHGPRAIVCDRAL